VPATSGGVEQRWGLIHSEPRPLQAPRPVDTQLRKPRAQAGTAGKKRCRTARAGAAKAPPALATFTQRLQATVLAQSTVRATPRSAKRGRPGPGTPPDQGVSQLAGALASRIAARQALVDQHRGVLLATHARDDTPRSPQEV
jgi:hypothetical protein